MLILYITGGTYSINSTPNYRFIEKLFMAILFLRSGFFVRNQIFWETFNGTYWLSRVSARNLLRGNRRRNNFRILFWCLAWGFSSNKPTHYLLDHGDFIISTLKHKWCEKLGYNPNWRVVITLVLSVQLQLKWSAGKRKIGKTKWMAIIYQGCLTMHN